MNAFHPAFAGTLVPSWYSYPHCEVSVTAPLMLGAACIADIEATVTVYRDPMGEWGVGEITVDGWQHNSTVKVPVSQDGRGWTITLPGFVSDAVFAEIENAKTIAKIEEALAKAEQEWLS